MHTGHEANPVPEIALRTEPFDGSASASFTVRHVGGRSSIIQGESSSTSQGAIRSFCRIFPNFSMNLPYSVAESMLVFAKGSCNTPSNSR